MSIVLNIKKEHKTLLNIPIATESFFERCWIKIARKHNLQFILSMQSGYSCNRSDLEKLSDELDQLCKSIDTEELETQDLLFLQQRLDYIIKQLSQALACEELITGYVG